MRIEGAPIGAAGEGPGAAESRDRDPPPRHPTEARVGDSGDARGRWLLPALSGATLVFFLATAEGYGYFRDELYYLANARHLGWGYVDHPPLIGWVAALVRATLGESLLAIRAVPALCAAATVWVVGATAGRLGGGGFAQGLAALAVLAAPVFLALFSFLSMNALDLLIQAVLWWLAVRLLAGADPRLWLVFGLVAGIGLETKIGVLFVGAGLAVGLVAARRWDLLRSRYLWLGAGLVLLLFAPYVAWNAAHGWPTVEFMANARAGKIVELSPLAFLAEQPLLVGPASGLLAALGVAALLGLGALRRWRALGWAFLAILALLAVSGGKPYYMAPAYPIAFAAGGVGVERWTSGKRLLRLALPVVLVTVGALLAPLAKPLLPVETFVAYASRLGIVPSSGERHELAELPQFFADMHGWPQFAADVAAVHRTLSPGERAAACVFAQNYGQAGAVDLFGPELGLPRAISGHNSYWLWGPQGCTGEVLLVIGGDPADLARLFARHEARGRTTCELCMPYERDRTIWVAWGLEAPLEEAWPAVKHYD